MDQAINTMRCGKYFVITYIGLLLLLSCFGGLFVFAAPSTEPATVSVSTENPELSQKQRIDLAWQIALAANNFSPGIFDASFGPNSRLAFKEYAASNFPGVNPFDPHDAHIYDALNVDVDHVITQYAVTQQDIQAVGELEMHDWLKMATLDRMPYGSLSDCLAEKFRCTLGLLQRLNPDVDLDALQAGQMINVPNIRPFPGPNDLGLQDGLSDLMTQYQTEIPHPPVAYLTVNFTQKVIRAYDDKNEEVALFRCSIARLKEDLPTADGVIQVIALDPNYTFDPKSWPEVHGIDQKLIIPPGPRNPVGVVWMGLNLPGVGLHGNPVPQYIGVTGSHGCFRMTNWDAAHLATMVQIGTPVIMINPAHPITDTLNLPPGIDPPGLESAEIGHGQ
ncbi:MAG TPA: L,D-transpeptidase family protein [Phycisphaerae bacterium]|nr:L,D-transpeptidase family protein [Phycisphaerae bacterium]